MSKESKSYTRKLGKLGTPKNHSYYVTLPMPLVRKLKLQAGQTVEIKRIGKKIQIIAS